MLSSLIVSAFLSACLAGQQGNPPDDSGEKVAPVDIKLKISVDSFATDRPKGVLSCTLQNNSNAEIAVPQGVDNKTIIVFGRGKSPQKSHRWPLKLYRRDGAKTESVKVLPGESMTIFEIPLAKILNTRSPGSKPNSVWSWDWIARPRPPMSPIHHRGGFMDTADFWVEFQEGDDTVRSTPATLKIEVPKIKPD